jgi:8-oxo-dGTP pyrophosphatase MutT (NUDIX family)
VADALLRSNLDHVPEAPLEVDDWRAAVADGPPVGDPMRHSAVLIALFEEEGEARVLLTRRAGHLRTHASQVSFPGGRIDPGETPLMAALREAEEEVGLAGDLAAPLGHLPSVVTMVSGSLIQPVVVSLPSRPELLPNPGEVARAFDVALADLLALEAFREEVWVLEGIVPGGAEGVPMWFFEVAGELIWGATGRLLVDLLSTVLDLGPTRGFRV